MIQQYVKNRVGLISLGCPKNQVDSEVMIGVLQKDGYEITSDLSGAEIIIINTCSFIEAAKRESLETIFEVAELKKSGSLKKLIVAGCLPQRYCSELQREIPEVDHLLSVNDVERIAEVCRQDKKTLPPDRFSSPRYLYSERSPRFLSSPRFYAYVKIAEGCNHSCSFCIIPRIRGKYRSRSVASIKEEVMNLSGSGVKEINLIAQDTTSFGIDLGMENGLSLLIEKLSSIEGIRWIRILYGHPAGIGDSLLKSISSSEKICRYLDIPFQHASKRILRSMKRGGSSKSHLDLINKIRRYLPEITLRTAVIVGYPGETEAEFQELLAFCSEARFDHLGVFRYSHEEGTEVYDLDDSISEELKEERYRTLMAMQQGISLEKNRSRVGKVFDLICEGVSSESDDLLSGRMESQAPDIDSRVLINEGSAEAGEFVRVQITESHPYDLVGKIIGKL
ncbi:MAG: 30S ribosomal protein S12 methylthiotransferase RimO [Acidobacteriota bacterium]